MNRVIERVLNLLAFLLSVGRPVTADEIRHTVAGYDQETDEAFRRTFERDKDLLRQLGVPIRMEHTDAWEVEQGYVVAPDEYALDDPGLTDEERTALWIAATMVRLGGQAAGPAAIFKLGGASALAAGEPLTADLGAEGDGLAHRRGHWYIVGGTTDGVRVFRVDRMTEVAAGETSGAFERPSGFRLRDELPDAPWTAGEDDVVVEVVFDAEVAWWARRQVVAAATTITEESDGAITVQLPVAQVDAFVGWLISFDDHAEILAPPEIRDRFINHVVGS